MNHRIKGQAFQDNPKITWPFKPPSNNGCNYKVSYLYIIVLKGMLFKTGIFLWNFLFRLVVITVLENASPQRGLNYFSNLRVNEREVVQT